MRHASSVGSWHCQSVVSLAHGAIELSSQVTQYSTTLSLSLAHDALNMQCAVVGHCTYFVVCLAVCSARGTVCLYVQLSAPVHSYASFGLAVHATCWTWPPFTLRMPRSVLGSRHRLLVCAAVGSSAQLSRLWACSACGVLDVAAAYSSYASQRAQLKASPACTSVKLLADLCVAPSLGFLHLMALHLLPCSHSAWLMAPSACSLHTMACITSVLPQAYPHVAPSLWFLHSMALHLSPCRVT